MADPPATPDVATIRPGIAFGNAADIHAKLVNAAYDADMKGVMQALSAGADINYAMPKSGLTALHVAVGTNNLPLVRYLVEERGARFKPDRYGRWPTTMAAECRADGDLCDYIVEKEAEAISKSG